MTSLLLLVLLVSWSARRRQNSSHSLLYKLSYKECFLIGRSTVIKQVDHFIATFVPSLRSCHFIGFEFKFEFKFSQHLSHPSRRNDVVLIKRLGLPSTLIRHENGAHFSFSKTLFKPEEFENVGFAF